MGAVLLETAPIFVLSTGEGDGEAECPGFVWWATEGCSSGVFRHPAATEGRSPWAPIVTNDGAWKVVHLQW